MVDRPAAALFVLLAATLAACETAPPPPLYQPREVARTYGYFEQQLSADRYRVGYSAPVERSRADDSVERRRETDGLIDLAYDLALLRAAQLAVAAGRPAFEVSERENNVQVDVRRYYYDPVFPGPFPFRRYGWYPYPYHYPYYYGPYASRDAVLGVETQMTVTMLDAARPGAFDARETLDRLRSKYPDAIGYQTTAAPSG